MPDRSRPSAPDSPLAREGRDSAGALAAGSPDAGLIALLAADQPFLDADGIAGLAAAVGTADGAAYVDDTGQVQFLCAVWRVSALTARLAAAGVSMRSVYAGADIVTVPDRRGVARDVDTPGDLRAARAELDGG